MYARKCQLLEQQLQGRAVNNIPIINTIKWKPKTLLAFSNLEAIDV